MRPSPVVLASALAALAAVASAWAFVHHFRNRVDPEKRRRTLIDAEGRIIEGFITDWREGLVVYTWSWRGVDYEASQDVRELQDRMPVSADATIGPVSIKFLPKDPSNSIVISENWSGFQNGSRR